MSVVVKPLSELPSTKQGFNLVSHPGEDREDAAKITADGSLIVVHFHVHDVPSPDNKTVENKRERWRNPEKPTTTANDVSKQGREKSSTKSGPPKTVRRKDSYGAEQCCR